MTALGRHDDAIAEAVRARQLDPVSPIINTLEGASYYYAGRFDDAVLCLQKALELNPHLWIAYLFRGKVALEKKNYPEAFAEFKLARQFSGNASEPISMLVYTATRAGDTAQARAILEELLTSSRQHYISPFNLAVAYLALGQRDECFAWMEKAYQDRDVRMSFLRVDPKWDEVRSDPRFASLLQRTGLL